MPFYVSLCSVHRRIHLIFPHSPHFCLSFLTTPYINVRCKCSTATISACKSAKCHSALSGRSIILWASCRQHAEFLRYNYLSDYGITNTGHLQYTRNFLQCFSKGTSYQLPFFTFGKCSNCWGDTCPCTTSPAL